MKKIFISIILYSQLSFAIVVSDPGSYARFAQQINVLSKMLDNAESQLKKFKSLENSITGSYNYAGDIIAQVRKHKYILNKINNMLPSLTINQEVLKNLHLPHNNIELLDEIFVSPLNNAYGDNKKNLKNEFRQNSVRSALEQSQIILGGLDDNFQRIDDIVSQINLTPNIKASIDLTNKLISELVIGQQVFLSLFANISRANMAQKYIGNASKKNIILQSSGKKIQDSFVNGLSFYADCAIVLAENNLCNKD
jgi:hypothetical protein